MKPWGGSDRSEIALRDEAGACASRRRPADLRFHLTHARNRNRKALADAELFLGLDPATLVREVGQPHRRLAAVGAMENGIDLDRMANLTLSPAHATLHTSP